MKRAIRLNKLKDMFYYMPLEAKLMIHTEPPRFREERFTLPLHVEGEYLIDVKASELMSVLRQALQEEPHTKLQFVNYLESESFRVATENGRKTVNVDDVIEAYNRIYDS